MYFLCVFVCVCVCVCVSVCVRTRARARVCVCVRFTIIVPKNHEIHTENIFKKSVYVCQRCLDTQSYLTFCVHLCYYCSVVQETYNVDG
jgi:Na+-transporting NADH:ubiquinone oxidoreductase subunit NqrE